MILYIRLSVIVKIYFALYQPILGQCSVTEPPQNMQKILFSLQFQVKHRWSIGSIWDISTLYSIHGGEIYVFLFISFIYSFISVSYLDIFVQFVHYLYVQKHTKAVSINQLYRLCIVCIVCMYIVFFSHTHTLLFCWKIKNC